MHREPISLSISEVRSAHLHISLQDPNPQDKPIRFTTVRILTGALFAFDLVSQTSRRYNRQQRKTALPRGDGRPKFMQCNDRLNHMVNAFRSVRSYRFICACINVSEDCQSIYPKYSSLRIYIQDQGSRRQLSFRCSISKSPAAY